MSGDDERGSDADRVRADESTTEAEAGEGVAEAESGDGGWRFALDEVGEEAGPPPLEPGSPETEHVVFVLVGVALTVVLLVGAV